MLRFEIQLDWTGFQVFNMIFNQRNAAEIHDLAVNCGLADHDGNGSSPRQVDGRVQVFIRDLKPRPQTESTPS